jgi:GST-like protein
MIELHYWPTSNGHKISMCLEEMGLAYEIFPVNIGKGDQFKPEFIAISPNNRIPAIVDRDPADGGGPLAVFESGAILAYLAEKTGQFMPSTSRGKADVLSWVFWQVGGLGPMAGQKNHFIQHTGEKIAYAIERYTKETDRLIGVLDRRLDGRDFVCGTYTIADMAIYPWIFSTNQREPEALSAFPNVRRWFDAIRVRPPVVTAYAKGDAVRSAGPVSEEERHKVLYGQTAANVAERLKGA